MPYPHAGPTLRGMGWGPHESHASGGRVRSLALTCPPHLPALPWPHQPHLSKNIDRAPLACGVLGRSQVIQGGGDLVPALRDLTAPRRRHHDTHIMLGREVSLGEGAEPCHMPGPLWRCPPPSHRGASARYPSSSRDKVAEPGSE